MHSQLVASGRATSNSLLVRYSRASTFPLSCRDYLDTRDYSVALAFRRMSREAVMLRDISEWTPLCHVTLHFRRSKRRSTEGSLDKISLPAGDC